MPRIQDHLHLLKRIPKALRMIAQEPAFIAERIDSGSSVERFMRRLNHLPNVVPLNVTVRPELSAIQTLNVLLPSFAAGSLTGGPNTAINLASRLAAEGIPVRFIATDGPLDRSDEAVWDHFASVTEIPQRLPNAAILSAYDRSQSIDIGRNDVFFAVHDKDISHFCLPRIQYGIRWLDDAISETNGGNRFYPERVNDYRSWE